MKINGHYNAWDIFRFGFGYINTIRKQRAVNTSQSQSIASEDREASIDTMRQSIRMRKALEAVRPIMYATREIGIVSPASATSVSGLGLDTSGRATTIQSTEEVNAEPTSISTFAPEWSGSTARATIGGEYDGSNGTDTLTFKVTQDGTHGADDLQLKVYNSSNDEIDKIDIRDNHAIDQQYTLDNGLVLTLGEGDLRNNDTFAIGVDDSQPTAFTPSQPDWSGSTASATIGGEYDGSQGTGTLMFKVDRGGTHGEDDLKIKVYEPGGSFLEDINIDKEDPLDTGYALSNGLVLTLNEGDLLDNDTFTLDVSHAAPTAMNGFQPQWGGLVSSAQATIDGTYDGSNGTGALTFEVNAEGTHGEDDLQIKVFDPNNNEIDQFDIKKEDAIDQQYALSNGLIFTLGEGDLLKDDTFTLEVSDSEPTSFSGYQPEWAGLGVSDAPVTLDGTYDGAQGIGTFNFVVDKAGTHGQDDLKIKVYQPDGSFFEDINIDKEDPLDTQYTLSNGIDLTLGAGDLLETDSFSITFTETIGSTVDPDKPFNGTGNDNPNLEFGLSVNDGSFQINGVSIEVNAGDSINSVLDRINQSEAGVTAIFEVASEKVLLTQNAVGSVPEIVLQNDTSGFLAAVKLDEASAIPGEKPENEKPLAEVERFAAVQSGMIGVNDETILIDINTDSLTDILNRITASGAAVSASFDDTDQRVSLHSDNPDNQLILDSGATHFFSALGISDGTYNSENDLIQTGVVSEVDISNLLVESVIADTTHTAEPAFRAKAVAAADAEMLGTLVHVIADSMNSLFDDSVKRSSPGAVLEGIRKDIYSAISSTFGSDGPQFNTDFGINFDFRNTSEEVFKFSQADQGQLAAALSTTEGQAAVHDMFFGNESNGMLNRMHDILTAAESRLADQTGSNGIFLDTLA